MKNSEEIKSIVKEKYQEIAIEASSCCGSECGCGTDGVGVMSESYSSLDGYVPDADLALGCGIPTQIADIRPGQTVLDLGSGAGNDVFVARSIVGPEGKVIGVDMTEGMIARANQNKKKLGFTNVEFRLGDIERLPVESESVDVVISNCVLNLVPEKSTVFSEIFRVLKRNGHFSISDIVLTHELPAELLKAAELIAGCVSGAIRQEEYLDMVSKAGFQNIAVRKERTIGLSDELLSQYMTAEQISQFRSSGAAIRSITVYGEKHEKV